ncbi:hypothetical protein THAOC_16421 [Thalassiosira oceanica]|uniref:tRNA threonylcarbamoyladenosine biosynthesis protein TsaE n=1 Tax=Thalassiosira oceanica TaxID=159749 RepID=K0S9V1_THAOC|nr:hypothetical protein THAOC_16421 [Thalassiosira oceanica]|eukprot:EJK62948.1 hypothetical protein THAOC_16421 [Thalassiosira oceanica]
MLSTHLRLGFLSRQGGRDFVMYVRRLSNAFLLSRHDACFVGQYRRYQRSRCIKSRDDGKLITSACFGASDRYSLELTIPTPEDMEDIGGLLSVNSLPGDVILLDGDLGAGKTCFSRGFVRAKTGLPDERVTSPTYLLSNAYSVDSNLKVYHMDLYRLSGNGDDLAPLDLENVFENGISLIEWPSRLATKPETRLDITLTIESAVDGDVGQSDDENEDCKSRRMRLDPHGVRWVERLEFLEREGYFEDLLV